MTREARQVCVKCLALISYENGELTFEADVSKGTYIRVLADDLAMRLGTCANLTALRRTRVGDLSIDDAGIAGKAPGIRPEARNSTGPARSGESRRPGEPFIRGGQG